MRIIAGQFRSRKLLFPSSSVTRPTSGRVRESVFNILQNLEKHIIESAFVADVFAGSGAYGLEALSRGAGYVYFIEKNTSAARIIQSNISSLQAQSKCCLIRQDALQPCSAPRPMNLLFLDPPYGQNREGPCLSALTLGGWIDEKSLVVLETSTPPHIPENMTVLEQRRYGIALVSFLKFTG